MRKRNNDSEIVQTATIKIGTTLSCGKVVAIANDYIMVNNGSKVNSVSFEEAELCIIEKKEKNNA